MNCNEVRLALSFEDPDQRVEGPALGEHLQGCAECREDFPELAPLLAASGLPAAPTPIFRPPASALRPPASPRHLRWTRPRRIAAAALLLSSTFAFLWWQGLGPGASPPAVEHVSAELGGPPGNPASTRAPTSSPESGSALAAPPSPGVGTPSSPSVKELLSHSRPLKISTQMTHSTERRSRNAPPQRRSMTTEIQRISPSPRGFSR